MYYLGLYLSLQANHQLFIYTVRESEVTICGAARVWNMSWSFSLSIKKIFNFLHADHTFSDHIKLYKINYVSEGNKYIWLKFTKIGKSLTTSHMYPLISVNSDLIFHFLSSLCQIWYCSIKYGRRRWMQGWVNCRFLGFFTKKWFFNSA